MLMLSEFRIVRACLWIHGEIELFAQDDMPLPLSTSTVIYSNVNIRKTHVLHRIINT